jgi:hypothetical protein
VTRDQRLYEVRKALALDERLAGLLKELASDYATDALRQLYHTNEPAVLIRQSGLAEGVEKFITHITKAPTTAQS